MRAILEGRTSGILLHPTSLPGPHGIGDIGPAAHRFLDYLVSAGQSLWQVLPLGPTGYGDSPYACFSSFAGNPLLISLEALLDARLLEPAELADGPAFAENRVDFGPLIEWKLPLLRRAASRFLESASAAQADTFRAFARKESWWLEDYSLFIAIKEWFEALASAEGRRAGAWNDTWDRDTALRRPRVLEEWKKRLERPVWELKAIQFFFFSQWDHLRAAAARKGIRLIGDLPIFAAPDSVDVWAHRRLFLLDGNGLPTVVSGVPPDYFTATGQLWGNPLYDWDALSRDGFRFWKDRIRSACRLFDLVRIDHFRGFQACWTVPAGAPTAERGSWVKVPGVRLFETMQKKLGPLPIIAEDLGVITPEVTGLRKRFGFPGMRILQFAFDEAEWGPDGSSERFLPHNHTRNSVVYTGTHDNDTTRGWWDTRSTREREKLTAYAGCSDPEVEWRMIRMAMSSVCAAAIVPAQDVLGLGTEARMNTPGTSSSGNWSWRAGPELFDPQRARRLRSLAETYGRLPAPPP